MKQMVLALLGVLVLVSAPGVANAGMIGDSITVNRLFPDLLTIYTPPATLYSVDLEANSIVFDFLASSAFGGAAIGVFDGLQFLGLSQPIGTVGVVGVTGITVAGLAFGTDFINLDLDGVFGDSAALTLQVDFAAPTPVPEPGTLALALLGVGVGLPGSTEPIRSAILKISALTMVAER